MSDFKAIADRVEIDALRGEVCAAAMLRDNDRLASLFTQDTDWPAEPPTTVVDMAQAPGLKLGACC
jgi:hypothetical protein